jgi:hypothetical protein
VITRLLDIVIVLLSSSILVILALGGIDYALGALEIRLHSWTRPLALLLLALGIRTWLVYTSGTPEPLSPSRLPKVVAYVTTRGLAALLLATMLVYAHYHVQVAGGLDSYGYVSTASLLASGRISEPQPLISLLPFESASTAAAPLGHVPSIDGRSSVPRFPIGLPAVMALFTVFGATGPFYVPLVMAYVAIALVYLLASEPGIPASGLFAAVLVAVDPLMVHYATQPMSDVPAACWLIAAVWLTLERSEHTGELARGRAEVARRRARWAIAAGICAGMAMLTRPALLPAVIVLGGISGVQNRLGAPALKYGATLLAFVVLQMILNWQLYGSAALSGYGPASHMFEFSLSRFHSNAANFGKWLTYSHTPLIWLLWPIALIILWRTERDPLNGQVQGRRWAWQLSAVAAAAAAPYLFYLVFDDWESSRFLLPTIVLVLVLFARALCVAITRLTMVRLNRSNPGPGTQHPEPAQLLLLGLAFVCAIASHRFLEGEGVYRYGSVEMKYVLAGEWFKTHTPERAVVLAGLHSGSIRYYGKRETIRWDQIPSGKLAATLRSLRGSGYEPYLALDVPTEPPLFAERFKSEPGVETEQVARIRVVNVYRFVSAN